MLPAPTTTKDPTGRTPLTSWGSFSIFKPSPRFLHFPVRHRSYQVDSGLRMARGRSTPSLRPIPLPQPIFSGSQTDGDPSADPHSTGTRAAPETARQGRAPREASWPLQQLQPSPEEGPQAGDSRAWPWRPGQARGAVGCSWGRPGASPARLQRHPPPPGPAKPAQPRGAEPVLRGTSWMQGPRGPCSSSW